MAQLNQLQFSYSPREDRMLLRINLTDGEEFTFWWTRAMIKALWPALQQCAGRDPQVQQQGSLVNREAVQEFQHQAAVEKTDFATPYQPPAGRSTQADPRASLVAAAQLTPHKNGLLNLRLKTDTNLSMDIKLNNQLLHAFMHMLQDSARKTHWDLELSTATVREEIPGTVN